MMPLCAIWKRPPAPLSGLTRPVTAISQWSYSIYLCHYPIIMGIYPWFGMTRDHPGINLLSKAAGVALTLLVARMIFRFVESPFTAMRPAEIAPHREKEKPDDEVEPGEKAQPAAPIL